MNTQTNKSFIPYIPDNAPFSTEQRSWLNGFLAGIFSNAEAPAVDVKPKIPLTILFGSETGNSASLAKKTAKQAEKSGFEVSVSCMSKYSTENLLKEKNLLVLTSTYGDGEPPASAAGFYDFIHSDQAPQCPDLKFSVLALGDSNYPDFCKCGKDFDLRFEQLKAQRISPRIDCDVDYDDPYAEWMSSVFSALGDCSEIEDDEDGESGYTKKNPFLAKVVDNYNLNTEESAKETRHIAISLEGSGLSYKPGDALGVYPRNCPELAGELIRTLGFDADAEVQGKPLSELLVCDYDITTLVPVLLSKYAEFCTSDSFRKLLESTDDEQRAYCHGREIIDLILEFPPAFEGPDAFVGILKKLAPRLYSISSSPSAHKDEVHLTVGAVRYESNGRKRGGVCSTFLADRCGEGPLPIYFHHNDNFRLPEDGARPVIMIGPGTGIAPFRAFLEERTSTGASGPNWLFFGDQHAASDFLYQDQLDDLQKQGVLSMLDTAFSRDQAEKIYVQDRMREKGEELYKWIQDGAYIYVCGDASRMAKDVETALLDIIEVHGGISCEEAAEVVKSLKAENRYCRDVY
jgi:sulfite reductase (NADPH) flavoprotein alpha-component